MSRQARIIETARNLVADGFDSATAIDMACKAVSSAPSAKRMARMLWSRGA